MWENMRTLLTAVIPVAEQAGVRLALHPEDPPVGPGRPGRLSALRVFHTKSILYGAFVWARRALNRKKTAGSGPRRSRSSMAARASSSLSSPSSTRCRSTIGLSWDVDTCHYWPI